MATAPKKRGQKKRARGNGLGVPMGGAASEDAQIIVNTDDANVSQSAPNVTEVDTGDGHVIISVVEEEAPKKPSNFDDNLAEDLDDMVLGRISNQLLEAIEQDDSDRSEWLQQRSDGLDLLGQKVEKPGSGNVGSSSTAVAGQSTVRDALLSEACDQFQATAYAELCPSDGPCKGKVVGEETDEADLMAQELEDDFNFYLASNAMGTAKEYYPDMRRMLWWTGYASGTFKKVYRCPLRERPVSESVDGADLIVPSNATDLGSAARITHRIDMSHVTMKQMQLQGAYREVDLTQPTPMPNALTQKEGDVTGLNPTLTRPEDQDYTIYEIYTCLDLEGFEHKRGNKPTGLPVPYRVVIDKDSRTVLEVRRNWNPPQPGEEDMLPVAKIPFVFFPYATGLGFYGTGLLHRLGNYVQALTAMLRISIDSGMFANFPGFLFAKPAGRQLQNEFRVPPGGGAPIDVSAVGNNINNAVMPLPYKPVDAGFVGLMGQTRENASRYGSMANMGVAEGKQNAPVGTTLALIEQATRIEGGVHRALHAAQAEEFQLLKELFREDPEALWRGNKRPAMGIAKDDAAKAARLERFKRALENCDIIPASDPNVASKMHRMGKGTALFQAASALPMAFNIPEVLKEWGGMMQISNMERFIAAPQEGPPPLDAATQAKIGLENRKIAVQEQRTQIDAQKAHAQLSGQLPSGQPTIDAQKLALQAQQGHAQLQSKEQIEAIKVAHQAHQTMQPQQDQGPDPLQARALDLKQQQIDQDGTKIAFEQHHKQKELDSKEAIEAFKFATTAGVHPDAAGIMDQTLTKVAPFLEPAAQQRSMAPGGAVKADAPPQQPAHHEVMEPVNLALEIERALRERRQQGYMQ